MSSKITAGNESVGEGGKSAAKAPDIIYQAREEYGRYFGIAVHTITLKPASVKAVLPIPKVQVCSAPGTNVRCKGKKKAVSVKPANFSGNSDLKVNTSVFKPKNRSSPKKCLMLF
jgi:hypothetical protein